MTKERQSMDSKRVSEVPLNRSISCLSNLLYLVSWIIFASTSLGRRHAIGSALKCLLQTSFPIGRSVSGDSWPVTMRTPTRRSACFRISSSQQYTDMASHRGVSPNVSSMRCDMRPCPTTGPECAVDVQTAESKRRSSERTFSGFTSLRQTVEFRNVRNEKRCPNPAGTRGTSSPTRRCCSRVGDRWGPTPFRRTSSTRRLPPAPVQEDPKQTANVNLNTPTRHRRKVRTVRTLTEIEGQEPLG